MTENIFNKTILKLLKSEFPEVYTPLTHSSAYQLLIAVILSSQTMDNTTNKVTPALFKKYPNVQSLAKAKITELENIIKVINFYKTKARNLKKTAILLLEKYNGIVPTSIRELIILPGVGRKVANVVVSEWFARHGETEPEGVVVDTHVKRVSKRLGITNETDSLKVEADLTNQFSKKEWLDLSLRLIFLGRKFCKAQNPLCSICFLRKICPKNGV